MSKHLSYEEEKKTYLKPCPFCGCNNIVSTKAVGEYWCNCNGCGASTKMCATNIKALEAWNKRV